MINDSHAIMIALSLPWSPNSDRARFGESLLFLRMFRRLG